MDIKSVPDRDETTMEETDEPQESEFEADNEYTDIENEIETVEEGVTPAAAAKLTEEFRGGIVRGSVDSDDDDYDDYVVEEETEEEETEEAEEEEDIEENFDFVDEDALDQEILANTLNNVLQEKEQLIREYLRLVTQSDRLKLRNMYLQDYLYKLCFRKNLLYENTETQRTTSFHRKAMSKFRNHHQRKLNKKMKTHFHAFATLRNKPVEFPPFRVRKEDKKKRENRLRRLLHHKLRAPEFEKKVDTRIINFSKKQYRRQFRTLCRSWTKRVELDEDKLVAQKAAQHLQEMRNPEKKILTGIKMGQARKPRVLVEKAGKPVLIVSKDGKVIDAAGNVVDVRKNEDDTESKVTETKGGCTGKKLPEESIHSANSVSSALFRTNTASKVRTQVPESTDDDKKRQMFANRSKSRLYFEGRSFKDVAASANHHHDHHQDIAKKLEKLKKINGKTGYKIPCKHKKKRFAKLTWFKDDKLNGRKSLGESLQLAEKQHVIHFVEDAILSLPQRKKVAKLRLKQQAHSELSNWDDSMERFIKLLKDCWELRFQHKKSMEEKFANWGLWEKRNHLCVEGLAVLFKSFVLQPYLSKGLLRSFYKDITEFTNHLNATHSGLMRQLIKMYRNKTSLVMIERKLKDTSNPALVNNGYTAEEYSAMTQDNDVMYQRLCKIEQQLEDERRTLARCTKNAYASQETKHKLKKLISHSKVQSLTLSDVAIKKANKIQNLKDTWNTTMDQNWNLFFKGSLFEKPNLMHDFGIRKLSMSTNDRDRKALKRELYLRRREQKAMHIKMTEAKARLRDLQIEGIQNQNKYIFRYHTNNIAKSGINRFASLSVAHCDSNLFDEYKKIKLRKAPSSNPEKLDQWF